MPKISVIIPVYNVEKYLNRSLDCLINQTLKDIEIILINDCSTDNSLKVMQEYASKDDRIKIIDLKENSGAAVARNKGLEVAAGEYLGFIDPDDSIDLNYYEELYKTAKDGDYDIAKCPLQVVHLDGHIIQSSLHNQLKETKNNHAFSYEWTTAIYRHSIIKDNNIRFPEECRKGQDVVFLTRVVLKASSMKLIDNVNYYYYKREDSLNARKIPLKNIKSALVAIKLMLEELNSTKFFEQNKSLYMQLFKKYYAVIYFTLGQNDSFEAKKCCAKALIDYFYMCKDAILLEKTFTFAWMIKYIKNKDFNALAKYLNKIKNNDYTKKPLLWYQKIFSAKNDNRGKYKKIIYILGLKFSIKKSPLCQKIEYLEEKSIRLEKTLDSQKQQFAKRIYDLNKKLNYNIQKYCPVEKREECLKDWYNESMHELLDLSNPKTYNEKIQWMKLYDSTPTKTKLADKYQVRDYIKEKIGEEYLIPLLGVWDKFEDIDFNKLPNQFVLKCNHGCGCNIIVKDKMNFNKEEARKKINTWLNTDYSNLGFELHYSAIPKKIIAEEFIQNAENELYDYKVWCFDGKAHYIQFLSERNTDGLKMAFYDRNWNKQNFVYSVPMDTKENKKPENLELLLELAEKLSDGFNHVRVDFYITNDNKIYFGEMTFTSCNGISDWRPKEADLMLGEMIDLNKVNTCV